MTVNIITDIISLLCGGGVGALISQLYTAKVTKRKLNAEADKAVLDVKSYELSTKHSAFETLYQQLNKCMNDYAEISENYRNYREAARKHEEETLELIQSKCLELAELKSKLTYYMGIRCYNSLCQDRVKEDPDDKPISIKKKQKEN